MPLLENLVCEFFLEWFGGAKIIVAGLNLMRLVRYWLIDTMKANIPASLHDFTDKVRDAIFDINN